MSLTHSTPSIITDGLVLCLDAANRRSYPGGSGTVWYNVSDNRFNGTLVNGSVFNPDKGGNVVFESIGDRVDMPFASIFDISLSMTIDSFIYPTAYTINGGGGIILAKVLSYYSEVRTNGKIRVYFYGLSSPGYHDSIGTVPLNQWSHFSVVRNYEDSTIVIYINGNLDRTFTSITGTITVQSNYYLALGGYNGGGSSYDYSGRIATAKLYNRALSAQEIKQNFNALRRRFGI